MPLFSTSGRSASCLEDAVKNKKQNHRTQKTNKAPKCAPHSRKPRITEWQKACANMRKDKLPLLAIRLKDGRCLDTEGFFSQGRSSEYLGMRWQEFIDPYRLGDVLDWLRDKDADERGPRWLKWLNGGGYLFYAAVVRDGEPRMAKIWINKVTIGGVAVCCVEVKLLAKPPGVASDLASA